METHRKPDSNIISTSKSTAGNALLNHKLSNSTKSYFTPRPLSQSNDILNSVDPFLEEPIPPTKPPEASTTPSTRILHIKNLVRPFTIHQLRGMLELYGTLINIQGKLNSYPLTVITPIKFLSL